jgi:hypothetical protein
MYLMRPKFASFDPKRTEARTGERLGRTNLGPCQFPSNPPEAAQVLDFTVDGGSDGLVSWGPPM